jgi:hypothetical protein
MIRYSKASNTIAKFAANKANLSNSKTGKNSEYILPSELG